MLETLAQVAEILTEEANEYLRITGTVETGGR
jgi:hypothetical protein